MASARAPGLLSLRAIFRAERSKSMQHVLSTVSSQHFLPCARNGIGFVKWSSLE
jgi:hypothetical protein